MPYDEYENIPHSRKRFRKLYLASFSAWMGSVAMGAVLGYSSPALQSMGKPNSHFKQLTDDEQSWVGSIMAIGALFGGIIAGPVVDAFGRKATLVFVSLPFTLGWLTIAYSSSIFQLLCGRLITGFGGGVVSLAVPLYIAETATPEVRGILGSVCQLSIVGGVLISYLLGEVVEWVELALISACFPILNTVLIVFMPETPSWLIQKGKREEAIEAIKFLNGNTIDPVNMYNEIQLCMSEQPTGKVTLREWLRPAIYKPFLISIGLMFFQQWCGVNGIMFYAANIFKQSKYDSISPTMSSIILASNLVLTSIVSSIIMDKAGRKTYLYISSVGMFLGLVSMGTLMLLGDKYGDKFETKYGWGNILSLSFYLVAFSLGYGPIPWLMMSEINNSRVRGVASSFTTAFNWINVFFITYSFMALLKLMNGYGAYFFFAAICVLSVIFIAMCVPETKGRTLGEIELWFASSEEDRRLLDPDCPEDYIIN